MYSNAAASLSDILSLAEKVDSVDYAVVRDHDVHFFYWLGCAECDPADPLNTRKAHCENTKFHFQIFN